MTSVPWVFIGTYIVTVIIVLALVSIARADLDKLDKEG